ncbi:hypothetical protein OIN59_18555 [Acidovorax sp. D2M1]|uniref:Uncharacterized protein n=1 Tax=Acidovorax benzenivorans TaxID=2987520 RepID=A0ABT5S0H3_9BURK|nr:hypothetical protein [Acidovorax benzenivorans]MDD2179443.1 hypothetical protein [Acidovorax benzenivorans]
MIKIEKQYDGVTLVDIQLASAYYPLLVDLAKHKHCLTYGELVTKAKEEYPNRPEVQNAIAVSTGRRLDVVRMFTSEHDLPDLTSLIISKGSGECGVGFTRNFDPKTSRDKVFAFDWSIVTTDFDGFLEITKKSIKPRIPVKETKALELMSSYYQENKKDLPKSIRESREQILELIMEGLSPEEAFSQARH